MVGDDLFEQTVPGVTRLAGVQADLHRARRFDLDDAEAVDRGEDRGESKSAPTLDDHGARGSGRRAHAAVEERERRAWCATEDGPGTPAFGVATRELQCVDVVDQREREWFAQFRGRCAPGVAVETATNDEPGATNYDGLDDGQNEQVEDEVAPETTGVRSTHVQVVAGEVKVDGVERGQDVKDQQRDRGKPDPATESTVEDT